MQIIHDESIPFRLYLQVNLYINLKIFINLHKNKFTMTNICKNGACEYFLHIGKTWFTVFKNVKQILI